MRALSETPIDAFALAADSSGIYWTTPANELWVLRTEQGAPERLAADAEAGPYLPGAVAAAARGRLRLLDGLGATRRCTGRAPTGGGDVVIARAVRGDNLAADAAQHLLDGGAGQLRPGRGRRFACCRIAARRAPPPLTLVTAAVNEEIASLAIRDGVLYWTPFGAIGATSTLASCAARRWRSVAGRRRGRGTVGRRPARSGCAPRQRRYLLRAVPQPVDDGGTPACRRQRSRRDCWRRCPTNRAAAAFAIAGDNLL